eukprot:CAMPEP_0118971800 /NCGR_PEP_ID=MMETSP1173-20130426/8321_1 /TAXON_ID=1034831 /ORGANISM="Rhizochromulina marina cf, Strain CCMP1243" /LENGTH=426 /DNA_ID=CAMNT_0006921289 /DNA_START=53 /DNA_END=1331 /DNA_ORIENTATION=-
MELFLGSRLNILALGIPFAIFGRSLGYQDESVFVVALVGLVPLAERVSWVTEQLAAHTSKTLGGLLSATFGNITELIVCLYAIHDRLYRLVQLSMLGSILGNLLLVLGMALFVGGLRHKQQTFNRTVGTLNGGLLMLASLAILFPAVLHLNHETADLAKDLLVSRFSAVVLLCMYAASLIFQLVTHPELFDDEQTPPPPPILPRSPRSSAEASPVASKPFEALRRHSPAGGAHPRPSPVERSRLPSVADSDAEIDDDTAIQVSLGFWASVSCLVGLTACISLLSDVIVETIKEGAKSSGLSGVFISAVVIPIAGNAAEHAAAIVFAYRDELDIAIGVAVGSSVQIALLGLPFCIVYAWFLRRQLTMYFEAFETAALVGSVFTTLYLINDGKSNYLIGLLLIGAYLVICAGFLAHSDEELESPLDDT